MTMFEKSIVTSELIRAGIGIGVLIILTYSIFPALPIVVNYALVAVVVGAFFFHNALVYVVYVLALLLWTKYTWVPTLELAFIGLSALCTFLSIKFFVLRKSFFILLAFLVCFHILFWVIFYKGSVFYSSFFYLEFLYNGACALFLYGVHSVLQRV